MVEVRLADGTVIHINGNRYYTKVESNLLIVESESNNIIFNFSHVAYAAMVKDIVKEDEDD